MGYYMSKLQYKSASFQVNDFYKSLKVNEAIKLK